ncbi:MAG: polyphosphate kinase 2 [Bacteroidia bacterium]|nr:polyphosphate kinase 2 [Bacteroidia bacterium]MBT8277469.1 polyphosphate kinase 2 [Bacteroidia bacterium]NND25267.1 polyphosphate kinase 2 [Flavobacteriaceae bacterium]NNK61088.1 polyphosphate kinase 2 [Flavobacteriaceae bacterium]NNL32819.1 polyphosphate kinase 2 [Flavobacteriaceae bacterium]
MEKLTAKELKRLNSKAGLRQFLSEEDITLPKILRNLNYEARLKLLQAELIHLQHWVYKNQKKIVIVFEGRDAAGKGGAIRRITEHLNPRQFKVVALPKPTREEKGQWYFQRYINQLPRKGQIVFFDRSWYNRAVVEPVNGFCTKREYNIFMNQVNDFERMIIESGITLIKFYFSITKDEQEKRFEEIISSPIKKWKYSEVDQRALSLWDDYTDYKTKMFELTNTKIAPWRIIQANRKSKARIEVIKIILKTIPYIPKDEVGIDYIVQKEEDSDK